MVRVNEKNIAIILVILSITYGKFTESLIQLHCICNIIFKAILFVIKSYSKYIRGELC